MANELVTQDDARELVTTDAPADFRAMLDAFFRDRQLLRGKWTLSNLPTQPERKAMDDRARALVSRLRPMSMAAAEMDVAAGEIGAILSGYLTLKVDPARATAGFVALLKDLPLFAVKHACGLLREGAVDGVSPEFPPTAPLIYKLAREQTEPYWEEAGKIKTVLAIRDARESAIPALSKEQRAAGHAAGRDTTEVLRKSIKRMDDLEREAREPERLARRERLLAHKLSQWRAVGRAPLHDEDGEVMWLNTALEREAAGLLPIITKSGLTISPSLAANIKEKMKQDEEFDLRNPRRGHRDEGS